MFISAFTPITIIGRTIGNERTGNMAFLLAALAIIADIIVETLAIAKLPIIINKKNNSFDEIKISLLKKINNNVVNMLYSKANNMLNNNFPEYTDNDFVCSFRKRDVPRSSSLMKLFVNPNIELKNISSQSIPATIPEDKTSLNMLKTTMVIVVIINKKTAVIEVLVLNSECNSLRKTEIVLLRNFDIKENN